ncbi:MAG: STAS domain-containing protein [Pseudomonadota bacterium]
MPITSIVDTSGDQVTIKVSGRFDFSSHQDFIQAYKQHPKGEKRFIVDLSGAEYMDSSAMGMLLQLREYSSKRPDSVILSNGNEAVQEILRIANFGKLFNITQFI